MVRPSRWYKRVEIRKDWADILLQEETGFGVQASEAYKKDLMAEFQMIRKELESQGRKVQPISVELDGQKVMKVLTRRGEDETEANL